MGNDRDVEFPVPDGAEAIRAVSVDYSGSPATREPRDIARRRLEAERKLSQHLQEARLLAPHQEDGGQASVSP